MNGWSISAIRRTAIAFARATLAAALLVGSQAPRAALAVPREIVILRHGEKANAFALCPTGVRRSLALRAQYLGKGAAASLFSPGERPAAFFVITLHTLELASPAAASWGVPLIDYSVVPLPGLSGTDEERELNERTREAANDVLRNPAYDGATVVMVWEHKHIANAKVERRAGAPASLRTLLHLDALGARVPKTWSGSNYDVFWIARYAHGSTVPVAFQAVRQIFAPPYDSLPQNAWATPDGLDASSGCE